MDRPLPLGGPRQRALLALLLIEQRSQRRDRHARRRALGGASRPTVPTTTLRSYVSRLRQSLGDGAADRRNVHRLPARPRWAPTRCSGVRTARFEPPMRDSRLAACAAARDGFAAALTLWRGRPFAGLSDDGAWPSKRIGSRSCACTRWNSASRPTSRSGRSPELIDELEALVRRHPYRERLWRSLMLALYHSGRQADALATYHRARQMLDEQFGLEPGDNLRALEVRHPARRGGADRPCAATRQPSSRRSPPSSAAIRRSPTSCAFLAPGGWSRLRASAASARRDWRSRRHDPRKRSLRGRCNVFVDLAPVTEPAGVVRAVAPSTRHTRAGRRTRARPGFGRPAAFEDAARPRQLRAPAETP